jgi:hypothetical protein
MNRSILVALILILALFLSCGPKAPVTPPPSQEAPAITETPESTTTASTPPTPTPTPPLPPLDAFMKGFAFADWNSPEKPRPPRFGPLYGPAQTDGSLKDLSSTGTNWILLVVQVRQETISSTKITRNEICTASDEALQRVIDLAHSLGMRVLLGAYMSVANPSPYQTPDYIGTAFTTEAQWQEWFASYRDMINHYAAFAQEAGADMFEIGHEQGATTHRESDWRRIAQEVRQVYKGLITYSALPSEIPTSSEELRIKWWDAVDYIGVEGYFPLTGTNNPTVEELKSAWVKKGYLLRLEELSQKWQKPIIITEMGYASADGINTNPVNYLRFLQAPLDLQEQADCYQAALEVLWGKPWLKGIFWWQWFANQLIWPSNPNDNNSYFPHGKPAEDVLKKYYLGDDKPK